MARYRTEPRIKYIDIISSTCPKLVLVTPDIQLGIPQKVLTFTDMTDSIWVFPDGAGNAIFEDIKYGSIPKPSPRLLIRIAEVFRVTILQGVTMIGHRIIVTNPDIDPYVLVTEPGDYYGPVGDKPAVHFILPLINDIKHHPEATGLHRVCSPPHRFIEEDDGTLTIEGSIACGPAGNPYFHGYLTKGTWSTC